MQGQSILLLGVILLVCGSASILVVRLCAPSLLGMGWLSGSFAGGASAAAMLFLPQRRLVWFFGVDAAFLVSAYLLHRAIRQLLRSERACMSLCLTPLIVQLLVDMGQLRGYLPVGSRSTALAALLSAQMLFTLHLLIRSKPSRALTMPVLFTAALVSLLALSGLIRFVALATHLGPWPMRSEINLWGFLLFLAITPGLAFGFFWMTTAALTAEVEQMASTDPLTRVFNRRVFLKWCEKELLRTQRSGLAFSLLMVDLDHFKHINDTFGHQRGDDVLCGAVESMQNAVRGIDVLCRWGGEEFAVLLPNAPREATRIVAERIRQSIELKVWEAPAGQNHLPAPRVTVSIGAAIFRDLDDDITSMLLRADRALYEAKTRGRNRVLLESE